MRMIALMTAVFVGSMAVWGCGAMPKYTEPADAPAASIRLFDKSSMDLSMNIYRYASGCTGRMWLFGPEADGVEIANETPFKRIPADAVTAFTVKHTTYASTCNVHFRFVPEAEKFYTVIGANKNNTCGIMLLMGDTPDGPLVRVEALQVMAEGDEPWAECQSWCGEVI